MPKWEDDKQQLIDNILDELNLLSSETEKLMLIYEVMMSLDKEKMPKMMRSALDWPDDDVI
jgi:hypothetical protein